MDTTTAIVEIFKSGVWPTLILILTIKLKDVIQDLATSLKQATLKFKDLEISFSKELSEARHLLEKAKIAPLTTAEKKSANDLLELAKIAPRAAISEAWIRVEIAGNKLASDLIDSKTLPNQLKSKVMFGEVLRSKNIIPSEVMKAITKLRDIRNRSVHATDFAPSEDDAEDYILLSEAVILDMNNATQKINQKTTK